MDEGNTSTNKKAPKTGGFLSLTVFINLFQILRPDKQRPVLPFRF